MSGEVPHPEGEVSTSELQEVTRHLVRIMAFESARYASTGEFSEPVVRKLRDAFEYLDAVAFVGIDLDPTTPSEAESTAEELAQRHPVEEGQADTAQHVAPLPYPRELYDQKLQAFRRHVSEFSGRATEAGAPAVCVVMLNAVALLPGTRFNREQLLGLSEDASNPAIAADALTGLLGMLDDPDSPIYPLSGYWRQEGEPDSEGFTAWMDPRGRLRQSFLQPVADYYVHEEPPMRAPIKDSLSRSTRDDLAEALDSMTDEHRIIAEAIIAGEPIPEQYFRLRDMKFVLRHIAGSRLTRNKVMAENFRMFSRAIAAIQQRMTGELEAGAEAYERYLDSMSQQIKSTEPRKSLPVPSFDPKDGNCASPRVPEKTRRAFVDDEPDPEDETAALRLCMSSCKIRTQCLIYGMLSDAYAGVAPRSGREVPKGIWGGATGSDRRDVSVAIHGGDLSVAEAVVRQIRRNNKARIKLPED
jgi:hypothetical protein